MRIKTVQFRQSGGYAGLVRGSELSGDTEISSTERQALERYARRSRGARASPARDLVGYEIELDTDEGKIRLEFDEANVPDELAPLVEKLAKRAKPVQP